MLKLLCAVRAGDVIKKGQKKDAESFEQKAHRGGRDGGSHPCGGDHGCDG